MIHWLDVPEREHAVVTKADIARVFKIVKRQYHHGELEICVCPAKGRRMP